MATGTVIFNTNMNLDTECHNSTVCGRHQVVEVTQLLNQYLLDNVPQETHPSEGALWERKDGW